MTSFAISPFTMPAALAAADAILADPMWAANQSNPAQVVWLESFRRRAALASSIDEIDGPFIVAVNRNGAPNDADKVVFAAYCDRDIWGRPENWRI